MGGGGKPGGAGLSPGDPNGAANNAGQSATKDQTGININTSGDHRVEVNHEVAHTEGNRYIEVKGGKGEIKIGGFLEFITPLKHTMTGGFKTTVDLSNSLSINVGPFTTEMLAAKYEILGSKEEQVGGTKSDTYTGFKFEKNNGPWTEAEAAKRSKAQALEKEINDAMAARVGPLLEATAAKFKATADKAREQVNVMDLRIASKLRVQYEKASMTVTALEREYGNIKYHCGKFERQCASMDEAVSALMEIKGSKNATKASAMKVKASLLKFTGSVVKLGE